MATFWDLLTEHSTLPVSVSCWEHLNNQEGENGGSGGASGFIYSKNPIIVTEKEAITVNERENISVSEPVTLKVETEEITLKEEEQTILEVDDG